jgi:hypothetical protein
MVPKISLPHNLLISLSFQGISSIPKFPKWIQEVCTGSGYKCQLLEVTSRAAKLPESLPEVLSSGSI